jgi:hypothetical protein
MQISTIHEVQNEAKFVWCVKCIGHTNYEGAVNLKTTYYSHFRSSAGRKAVLEDKSAWDNKHVSNSVLKTVSVTIKVLQHINRRNFCNKLMTPTFLQRLLSGSRN